MKLKLQYLGHLILSQLIGKNLETGKDEKTGKEYWQNEKGVAEDEIIRWRH